MKIILLKNFNKKKPGDIIEVKKGYGRNYFLLNLKGILYKKIYNYFYIKKLINFIDLKKKKYLNNFFLKINNKFFFLNQNFLNEDLLNDLFKKEILVFLKKLNFKLKIKEIYIYKNFLNINFINVIIYIYSYIYINIFIYFLN